MKLNRKKESRNKAFHGSSRSTGRNGLKGVSRKPTMSSLNGDHPNDVSPESKKETETAQFPQAILQPPTWLDDSSMDDPQYCEMQSPSWFRDTSTDDLRYLEMRQTFIREVVPRDAVEWILLLEFVNLQWQVMKFAKWQRALFKIAHLRFEGLNRAARRRLRCYGESEEDLDQRVRRHALGMRNSICRDEEEAETFLSRYQDLERIYRRLVDAQRRRDTALREIERRRIRMAKQVVQTAAAFPFPLSRTIKNGESLAPEASKNVAGEGSPLTTRRNGHG